VVNSPRGGCIPFARDVLSKPDGCVPLENQISQMYNPKLKSIVEELTKTLTGSQHVNADSYACYTRRYHSKLQTIWCAIFDHTSFIFLHFPLIPRTFCFSGFQDVRNACCCYVVGAHGGIVSSATISQVCRDRTSYVFWDPFHLTETANSIVAKHML